MKKNSNFFERILQLIDYYDIKSVNSFACDYLNYDSSEKINRLKKENTNPSYDIIVDISNKFVEIDMNWLITGNGNMLKSNKIEVKPVDNEWLLRRFEEIVSENALLKKENEDLRISRGNVINTPAYPVTSEKIGTHMAADPGTSKHTR